MLPTNPTSIQLIKDSSVNLIKYCKEKDEAEVLKILNNQTIYPFLDYNLCDQFGNTAFILACSNDMTNVICKLIGIIYDINYLIYFSNSKNRKININYANNSGLTALMYICINGNISISNLLTSFEDYKNNDKKIENPEIYLNLNQKDKRGDTALMHAVLSKKFNIVNRLLDQTDINIEPSFSQLVKSFPLNETKKNRNTTKINSFE